MDEPQVVRWITDHVDKMIAEEGIDLYRSDFNIDPLSYWRKNDCEDRQGITEIRYIEGYLNYWDELRRRHPGMLIDSWASGGRRDDLETMAGPYPFSAPILRTIRRPISVVLLVLASGYPFLTPPTTNGLMITTSAARLCHFFNVTGMSEKDTFDVVRARKCINEWRNVADYYFGDFWPLSDYDTTNKVWMAWHLTVPTGPPV